MPNWPKSEKTMVRLTPAVRTEVELAAQEERRSLSAITRRRSCSKTPGMGSRQSCARRRVRGTRREEIPRKQSYESTDRIGGACDDKGKRKLFFGKFEGIRRMDLAADRRLPVR